MSNLPTAGSTYAWDQYWADGRLASCGGEGGVNYQPVIANGWRSFFGALRDGDRVLDICTGNGAIALLAAETAVGHNLKLEIDAVDAAMIHPTVRAPGAAMIRFAPHTPAESLPFPDATFDVIVGQYAIEYTDTARSLLELHRVSRAAAAVRFVTHAAGSVVVRGAAEQLADVERLLATRIFDTARALATANETPANQAVRSAAGNEFRESLRALQRATTRSSDAGMYHNVGNVLVDAIQKQPRVGTPPVLAKIGETELAIRAHHARLSAMRNAALDPPRAQALATTAAQLWGRPFHVDPLQREDGIPFGWTITSSPGTD